MLALAGLDVVYTHEAENALHKAVQGSRVRMTLTGHTAEVNDVVFSPDGKRLASSSEDGVQSMGSRYRPATAFSRRPSKCFGCRLQPGWKPPGLRCSSPHRSQFVHCHNKGCQHWPGVLTFEDTGGDDYWMMNFSPDGSLWIGENGKIEFFDAAQASLFPR